MRKLSKVLAVTLAMAMSAVMMTACGGDEQKQADAQGDQAAGQEGKVHIDVIAKGFQHQFWKAVETGSKQAAEEFGVEVTFQGPDSESDIAQQVEYLDAAIAKNPSAICLAALDTSACISSITNAKDAGIPIVGFDSGIPNAPEGTIKANASTDNMAAGKLAATELYKLIQDKVTNPDKTVRIGVVAQESNSQSIVSRTKGFVDEMKSLIGEDKVSIEGHDSLKDEKAGAKVIIEVGIPAEVKDADGVFVASAILEKEDLIAIYGSNEFASNSIITANEGLDKLGPDKVLAVGFDAGAKQLDAIESKLFVGSITQDPVQIGYQAVKLAYMAQKGEEVSDVDTGAHWYNAENMNEPEIAPCLYR